MVAFNTSVYSKYYKAWVWKSIHLPEHGSDHLLTGASPQAIRFTWALTKRIRMGNFIGNWRFSKRTFYSGLVLDIQLSTSVDMCCGGPSPSPWQQIELPYLHHSLPALLKVSRSSAATRWICQRAQQLRRRLADRGQGTTALLCRAAHAQQSMSSQHPKAEL